MTSPGKRDQLVQRLADLSSYTQNSEHFLALIGLGSVGQAIDRLDDYSDLDLFFIVEQGHKHDFLKQLDWLNAVAPLVYTFRNTVDGYKILFEDGIFCEFAIFEAADLDRIPYTDARVIWAADPDFIASFPVSNMLPAKDQHEVDWYVNEILTNLYVGLCRFQRGEILNASRFIQVYAVDQLIELVEEFKPEKSLAKDPFSGSRRFEQRFSELSGDFPTFIQGYDNCLESALAILEFLESRYEINRVMRDIILNLANSDGGNANA